MKVDDFIVDKVCMYTLLKDKRIQFGPFNERFKLLHVLVHDYLNEIDCGFVSNNSLEFKEYLEEQVGEVEFSKSFAIRIRPTEPTRFFVQGREVFDGKKKEFI